MTAKTVIRLFVASPGDVPRERQRLRKVIDQINVTASSSSNCLVELKMWETHTFSSAGRPEEVIIEQIGEYDVFLGIMWKSFGTPTGKAESGTEEEFNNACDRLEKGEIKHLGFMFCERRIPIPNNETDINQLSKVVAFKKRMERSHSVLYKTYSTLDEYEGEIRKFIYNVIDRIYNEKPHSTPKNIDIDTEIELAKKYSSLGKYDDALSILSNLGDDSVNAKTHFKASEIEHLIALQYRHSGSFTKALEHYVSAEVNIHKSTALTPAAKILYLRIKAGRIMVDEYFLRGHCRKAFDSYEGLKSNIEDLRENNVASNNNDSHMLELYELHLLRQQAEMLRVSGQYGEALRMFRDLYKRYEFSNALEKAYCLLGVGDSLRLSGELDEAMEKYEDCERHASETRHYGLLSRVLRNKVMALVSKGKENFEQAKKELDRLSSVPGSKSRFNRIYYLLAAGAVCLEEDAHQSGEYFRDAISLSSTKQGELKIESLHGRFGLAESKRLNDVNNIDTAIYPWLHNEYRKIGMNWGIVRTFAVCELIGLSDRIGDCIEGNVFLEGEDFVVANNPKQFHQSRNTLIYSNIP